MWLHAERGSLAGQDVPLDQPSLSIGRGSGNDLVLAEQGVSRQHARIQRVSQGWVLADLGSTNGTLVNDERIAASHLLQPGDRLVIGGSQFVVRQAAEEEGPAEAEVPMPWLTGPQRTLVMILGAVLLVVVLVGVVLLLVSALRPEEIQGEATPTGDIPDLMTVIPIPTEMHEMATSVLPMLPSVLPIFPGGATETPEPGASVPGPAQAGRPAGPLAPTLEAKSAVEVGVGGSSP
jgi:pSer/pThr/pTyr-binding forkhead associated (FHA) protein